MNENINIKNDAMNLSNLIFPLLALVLGALFSFSIFPQLMEEPEPLVINEIKKVHIWCFEHSKNEQVWHIEGRGYLVKESPRGYPEIVGLYSRFHEDI